MNAPWKNKSYQADFDAAVTRAYQVFAQYYPDWVDYYFDEHFLSHEGAHLLANYRAESIPPDAEHLAAAWARQMKWIDPGTREIRIAELLPAAEHFLCVLKAEISSTNPECDPFVGAQNA